MKVTVLFIVILLTAASAHADQASVALSSAGGGAYFLEGRALDDVSGLEITLSYNASTLRNPRVVQGGLISGALMMTNTGVPGTVRIAAVRQGLVQGSGLIATITFDQSGTQGSGGGISGLLVSAVSSAGQSRQLPAVIQSSTTASQGEGQGSPEQGAPTSPSTAVPAVLPVIAAVVPAAEASVHERKEDPPAASDQERSLDSRDRKDAEARDRSGEEERSEQGKGLDERNASHRVLVQQSVLERFRDFQGPWTVEATARLFQQDPLLGCRQDPKVVLADGAELVTLTVVVSPQGKDGPKFSLQGGTLLSAIRDGDHTNTWVVKARPNKDVIYASLDVDDGQVIREFPITVAPRINVDLDGSGKVTERDFHLHRWNRKGAGRKVSGSFVDDYCFAANYLAAEEQAGKDRAARR